MANRFQVLCEGESDQAFLSALAKAYALPAFDSSCYASDNDGCAKKLREFEVDIDRGVIQKILVIADNDADPTKAFKAVRKQIKKAKRFKRPTSVLAPQGANPTMAVMMLPFAGKPGNLETLLLQSAEVRHPGIVQCVRDFATCSLAGKEDDWGISQRSKMLFHSVVAATMREAPNTSLRYMWGEPNAPVTATDPEFKWVAEFIASFFS